MFSIILLVPVLLATDHKFAEGSKRFTTNLNEVLIKENGNLISSPMSVYIVLSMAHQGSKGTTYDALTRVLGLPSAFTAVESYDMLNKLENLKHVKFNIANKIITGKYSTLKPEFKNIITTHFHSEAEVMDFSKNVESSQKINDWVANKTDSKIKKVINAASLNSTTSLIMLNTVCFNGSWVKQFETKDTTKEDFYLLSGMKTQVDMMHQHRKFQYTKNHELDAKILKLPYFGNEVSMYIILPNERRGADELENKIYKINFKQLSKTMYDTDVDLFLPKFKIESDIEFDSVFTKMGLGEMFSDQANFTRITYGPLKVSKFLHKAFIEVNEKGTETDAATVSESFPYSIPIKPLIPTIFRAEHPFIFAIVDNNFYDLLFFGRVTNPVY